MFDVFHELYADVTAANVRFADHGHFDAAFLCAGDAVLCLRVCVCFIDGEIDPWQDGFGAFCTCLIHELTFGNADHAGEGEGRVCEEGEC